MTEATNKISEKKILKAIVKVFRERINCHTFADLGRTCLEIAEELTCSQFGFIGEINQDGLFDTIAISNPGWDKCNIPEGERHLTIKDMKIRGIDRGMLKEGKSRILNSNAAMVNHPDHVEVPQGHPSLHTFLGVPLKEGENVIGMIGLANKEAGYTREDQEAIETLSVAMIEALRSKQSEEKIEKQSQTIKAANRAKSEFLANMSHEIRTPMNAVIGLTDLALQLTTSAQMYDYLTKISNSSQSLLRIINDILDFSKIEAGKLELERSSFMLRETFGHISDMFRSQVAEKHLEFILSVAEECRYELVGDSLRLEQILLNLISNAIKFTDEGEIEVQVKTIQEMTHQVTLEFSVRDTGIGLSKDQQTRLFEAFSQADNSTTRKCGGTGLGLSISRKLVEMMGGQIWVESSIEGGSVFYFTGIFECKLGSEDMIPPDDMEQLNVLVVDDNQAARQALQKMLGVFNFDATAVSSGQEALQAIEYASKEGKPFQLAVVDWLMPGMNGSATIKKIMEDRIDTNAPKSLLMVPFGQEEPIKSQAFYVDAFLTKPVNCSILFDTIMDVFGKEVTKAFRGAKTNIDLSKITGLIGAARALLVEDNPINQQVATEILEGVGISVEVAENGEIGVNKAKNAEFDVILMDIQMPVMDGYVATQLIRQDSRLKDIPIIAMTAHAMTGDREKSLDAGLNDHVTKPIDRKNLYLALVKWIQPRVGLGLSATPGIHEKTKGDNHNPVNRLPGINVDEALERIGGNRNLYRSLLLEFHRDYAHAAQKMISSLAGRRKDDLDTAKHLVHSIKGMAGNISAKKLHSAAVALEKEIKQPSEERQGLLDVFERALEQVVESIQIIKQQEEVIGEEHASKGENKRQMDRGVIAPILKELSVMIVGYDFKALVWVEKIKPLLIGVDEEFKSLNEHIENLDFEGAKHSMVALNNALDIVMDDD